MKKYTNFFASYHPVCQAIFFISIFFFMITINNPCLRLGATIVLLVYVTLLQGVRKLLKSLLYMIPLLALVSILNPIFVHEGKTILFYSNDQPITLEAVIFGLFSAVLIIGLIYMFSAFNECLDSHKLVFLLGRALPSVSLMITMVLRYMLHLGRRLKEITGVQETFGLTVKSGSLKEKLSHGSSILLSLISISLEDGIDTSDSMDARGYYLRGKTHFHSYRFKLSDILVIIVTLALDTFICFHLFSGNIAYDIYPKIATPLPNMLTIIVLVIYIILALLPIIINLMEELRWKLLRSKI